MMGQLMKHGEWVQMNQKNRPAGCPNCGSLSFARLRNKNGEILGNSVICGECKHPYELPGEDPDE